MSDLPGLEAAARAIWQVNGGALYLGPDSHDEDCARAAIAAAYPLILEQAAREAESWLCHQEGVGWNRAVRHVAMRIRFLAASLVGDVDPEPTEGEWHEFDCGSLFGDKPHFHPAKPAASPVQETTE